MEPVKVTFNSLMALGQIYRDPNSLQICQNALKGAYNSPKNFNLLLGLLISNKYLHGSLGQLNIFCNQNCKGFVVAYKQELAVFIVRDQLATAR